MDVKKQQVVSWHEAGHAVVADELGAGVDWIERNEDGSGHCHINSAKDVVPGSIEQAAIYAAGAIAEWLKFGVASPYSPNDLKGVEQIPPERRAIALERAEQILRRRWHEVEGLALRLLNDSDGFVPIPFAPDYTIQ